MRTGGHQVASLDINLGVGKVEPGKQNHYDLLSDSGFAFLGCIRLCGCCILFLLLAVEARVPERNIRNLCYTARTCEQ